MMIESHQQCGTTMRAVREGAAAARGQRGRYRAKKRNRREWRESTEERDAGGKKKRTTS